MKKYFFVLVLAVSILLSGCKDRLEPNTKTQLMMGTIIDITIYDKDNDKAFDNAFSRIKDLENKFSLNIKSSELNKINNASQISAVPVSSDTYNLINKSLFYSNITNGKFDVSIGPLVKSWGIGTDAAKIPPKDEISKDLSLISYKNIILSGSDKSVFLKGKGMVLDLGAIAKGYTADMVYKTLKDSGVKHAIINLGGNVLTLGNNPNDDSWKIGIQDPFSQRGGYLGIIKGNDNTSVVSSGIYERYFEVNGKRYHHILDVHTGFPTENNLAQTTIINNSSVDGDGLSTSTFVLGLDKGLDLINKTKNTQAIFVTKDKKVYITKGLKDNFVLTNNAYTLIVK